LAAPVRPWPRGGHGSRIRAGVRSGTTRQLWLYRAIVPAKAGTHGHGSMKQGSAVVMGPGFARSARAPGRQGIGLNLPRRRPRESGDPWPRIDATGERRVHGSRVRSLRPRPGTTLLRASHAGFDPRPQPIDQALRLLIVRRDGVEVPHDRGIGIDAAILQDRLLDERTARG